MSAIPETSLSLLSQSNSPSPPGTFTGILLAISVTVVGLYYASLTRLTCVLVSTITEVENAYLAGVENGLAFSADNDIAERLSVLQLTISTLRETSLRHSLSLSPLSFLCDIFNIRRSIAVLRCLREVRELRTYIEILHESQLRNIASASEARCQCPVANRITISRRRRDGPTRIRA
ncbi:hypothetical protein C8R45DRAFT_1065812 [Mycena sanguinolenta]|nr:hypothetical protein C8R45DRAFT_1065812 [Mycena sanguinolenta]